jgi:hypothetical protein
MIPARLITQENLPLVEERMKQKGQQGGSGGGGSQSQQGQSGGQQGSTAQGGQQPSKVTVKTTDGQSTEMKLMPGQELTIQIEGQIKSMETKEGKQGQKAQGGQSGGGQGQGGQGQGSSGGGS